MPHLRQQKFNDALTALEKALIGTAVEMARMWARVAFFLILVFGSGIVGDRVHKKACDFATVYVGCNMVQWR